MTVDKWDQRQVCPDGACIGVIGMDGKCKVCGRAAPNWGDPRKPGRVSSKAEDDEIDEPAEAATSSRSEAKPAAAEGTKKTWTTRQLCADGACVGVIGSDGKCKVCGKAADGSPASDEDDDEYEDDEVEGEDDKAAAHGESDDDSEDDDSDDDSDDDDRDDDSNDAATSTKTASTSAAIAAKSTAIAAKSTVSDDEDADESDDDDDDEIDDGGDGDDEDDEDEDDGVDDGDRDEVDDDVDDDEDEDDDDEEDDDESDDDADKRTLCSDGACVGVIGSNGKCKVCGKAAA